MRSHRLIVLALTTLVLASAGAAAQVPEGVPRIAVDGPAVYSEDYGKGSWLIVDGGGAVFIWGTGNVGFDNPIIAFDGLDGESFEDPLVGAERAARGAVWVDGPGLRGIWGTGNVGFDNPIIAVQNGGADVDWSGARVGFEEPALGFEEPALGVTGSGHAFTTPAGDVAASTPDLVVGGPEDVRGGTDGGHVVMHVPERRVPAPEEVIPGGPGKLPLLP